MATPPNEDLSGFRHITRHTHVLSTFQMNHQQNSIPLKKNMVGKIWYSWCDIFGVSQFPYFPILQTSSGLKIKRKKLAFQLNFKKIPVLKLKFNFKT
jgi:hypothetical protein